MSFQLDKLRQKNPQLRIVGNLPDNIFIPLIIKLLNQRFLIEDMHSTLQLEVAERLAVRPEIKRRAGLGVLT